jgi:hypothetical protein
MNIENPMLISVAGVVMDAADEIFYHYCGEDENPRLLIINMLIILQTAVGSNL